MQSQNRLLDDLARVASGALGVASGMRSEVETRLREQFERVIQQMDLVTRDDYEVVLAMAQKAREDQEDMVAKLAALEARIAELEQAGKAGASSGASKGGAAKAKSTGTRAGKSTTRKAGGEKKATGAPSGSEGTSEGG